MSHSDIDTCHWVGLAQHGIHHVFPPPCEYLSAREVMWSQLPLIWQYCWALWRAISPVDNHGNWTMGMSHAIVMALCLICSNLWLRSHLWSLQMYFVCLSLRHSLMVTAICMLLMLIWLIHGWGSWLFSLFSCSTPRRLIHCVTEMFFLDGPSWNGQFHCSFLLLRLGHTFHTLVHDSWCLGWPHALTHFGLGTHSCMERAEQN